MVAFRLPLGSLLLVFATCLGGCGGGGGGGASSAIPAAIAGATTPGGGSAAAQTASVTISVGLGQQSFSRRLAFVSSATKSATISVTPGAGSPLSSSVNCTSSCNATMTVPVGRDQFTVTLYDAQGGTGNGLATGSTAMIVVANQSNTLSIVFNGVVASLALVYDSTKLVTGTAATVSLTVAARDVRARSSSAATRTRRRSR